MKIWKRTWYRVALAIVAVPSVCILAVIVWLWSADPCAVFKPERFAAIERMLLFSLPASARSIEASCFWGAHVQFEMDSNEVCDFVQSSLINPQAYVRQINERDHLCAVFLNDEAQAMDSYLYGSYCVSLTTGLRMEILIDTSHQETYHVYARSYGVPIFGEQRRTWSGECPF